MTGTKVFAPSPQQQRLFDFIRSGRGNGRVHAVAGAGKTTSLIGGLELTTGSVAFAVYNKKNATEANAKIEERIADGRTSPELKSRLRVGTFHSFGFAAWRKAAPNIRIDDDKIKKIALVLQVPEAFIGFACSVVSHARQVGMGVLVPFERRESWLDIVERHDLALGLPEDYMGGLDEPLRWACKMLKESIAQAREVIDFDDMIYMPLRANVRMWQNDWVFVDEAQDLNPVRRALTKKMLRPGGRVIFVGDPAQAIYGFTGADADSFDLIAKEFGTTDLPLTVSWRCPRRVVEVAQAYVPGIEAAPGAPEGEFLTVGEADIRLLDMRPGVDAILCRNTKPLVPMAFALIRAGVPARIEGKAIGADLAKFARRWKIKKAATLADRLTSYLEKQVSKLMAAGKEPAAEQLTDKVETLQAIIAGMPADATVEDVASKIEEMFEDSDGNKRPAVVLSTIHRSKGLEWATVYWYGPDRFQPSPFARQDWQLEQEQNLMYVAATRAQERLIVVALGPRPVAQKEAA